MLLRSAFHHQALGFVDAVVVAVAAAAAAVLLFVVAAFGVVGVAVDFVVVSASELFLPDSY